jgi:hypothetical protein
VYVWRDLGEESNSGRPGGRRPAPAAPALNSCLQECSPNLWRALAGRFSGAHAHIQTGSHLLLVVFDSTVHPGVRKSHILRCRIDRSIAVRDVLNRRCTTFRLFQLRNAKQFLYKSSSSKVIGTASVTLTRMPRKGFSKAHAARVHKHHGIVALSVLNDDAGIAQTAVLVVGNDNVALCSFASLSRAGRERLCNQTFTSFA